MGANASEPVDISDCPPAFENEQPENEPENSARGAGANREGGARNRAQKKTQQPIKTQQPLAFKRSKGKRKKKKEIRLEDILPPEPTLTTKQALLHGIDFTVVDRHAYQTPYKLLLGSYYDLVEYLTDDDAWDDLVKARVLFRWVTSYDIMKMKIDVTPPQDSPLEYFSKIQHELGSYANLFYILCQIADLPCVVIEGINKSSAYKIGEPFEREALKAQWNAVYIYDEWRVIDTFWALACAEDEMPDEWKNRSNTELTEELKKEEEEQEANVNIFKSERKEENVDPRFTDTTWKKVHCTPVDEHYFFTNPSEIISTHFPDEEQWQLLEEPIQQQEFENQAFMRERFHQLEMKIADEKYDSCILEAEYGEAEIVLTIPPERSNNYKFKYTLVRQNASDERSKIDMLLSRFVIFEHLEDMLRFTFRFPIAGKFKLDVYGLDKTDPELRGYDLVCSYIMMANDAKDCVPLPDYPVIGWGPGIALQKSGIIPITHKSSSIITEDGKLEIKLAGKYEHKLRMVIRNPFAEEENIDKYAILRWTGEEYIVSTRLPKDGLYAMKFYAKSAEKEDDEHVNVLNYLIKCNGKKLKDDPFPNMPQGNLGANPNIHKLGVSCVGHEEGIIHAKDGFAQVEFKSKDDVKLSCELHSNSDKCAERMRVTQRQTANKTWFHLDLPSEGEYSMNVYAQEKNNLADLHNSHAFLVYSTGRPINEGSVGKVKTSNFWKDTTPVIAETVYTKKELLSIPVPAGMEIIAFLQNLSSSNPPSKKNVKIVRDMGVSIFQIHLPEFGEYIMNIYQRHENIYLKNIGRYYIYRSESVDAVEDELVTMMDIIREERLKAGQDVADIDARSKTMKKKSRIHGSDHIDDKIELAKKLFSVLNHKNPAVIRKAFDDYKATQPEKGNELMEKAKKVLRYKEAKKELKHAYKARNLEALEKALVKANVANTDKSLDMPILLGTRLRDRLRVLQRLRETVLKTDQKTVGELRSYDKPPDGVVHCVKAALMLLGYSPKETDSWGNCKAILGRNGNESVIQQIAYFDPKDVSMETAVDAHQMLEPYSEDKMKEISPGATSFYLWAKKMIKEIEASVGALKPKKPKPMKMKIMQPSPLKPKKSYVVITMDILRGKVPQDPEGLFSNNAQFPRKRKNGEKLGPYAKAYRDEQIASYKNKIKAAKEDLLAKTHPPPPPPKIKARKPKSKENKSNVSESPKTRNMNSNESTKKQDKGAKRTSPGSKGTMSPDFQKVPVQEEDFQPVQRTPDTHSDSHDDRYNNAPSIHIPSNEVPKATAPRAATKRPVEADYNSYRNPPLPEAPNNRHRPPSPQTNPAKDGTVQDRIKRRDPVQLLDYRNAATGGYAAHYELRKSYSKAVGHAK